MLLRANMQLMLILIALRGRFLFRRREKKLDEDRIAALDELFESLRYIVATAATMKTDWVDDWESRQDVELPPKYQPEEYLYPNAVEAAFDAKYTRALLYSNRWQSQIDPLFQAYDSESWVQVRAVIERSSTMLLGILEAHRGALRAEETSWIDRAVEGLDEARRILRSAEQREMEQHEVVATATFQTLYSVLQLSETVLDGLRREARER